MLGRLFKYFFVLQISVISADPPSYYGTGLQWVITCGLMSAWLRETAFNPSEITQSSSTAGPSKILLIPAQVDKKSELKLWLQGIVAVNSSSESDISSLEYEYDFLHQKTTLTIGGTEPILISYDKKNSQEINIKRGNAILANITPGEHLRVCNVYMVSAGCSGGNEGHDREKKDNKKTNKADCIECDQCKTPYYAIDPRKCPLPTEVLLIDKNWKLKPAESSFRSSACTYFRAMTHYCNRQNLSPNPFNLLENYPPCSFYADLDQQNPARPAQNVQFNIVYIAMGRWSQHYECRRHVQSLLGPLLEALLETILENPGSRQNQEVSQPATTDDNISAETRNDPAEEDEQPNRCATQ